MTAPELIAASLGLSIAIAALAGLAVAGLERVCADPALRDRAWAWALYLPVMPPLAVAATLLAPAPVRPTLVLATAEPTEPAAEVLTVAAPSADLAFTLEIGHLASAALGLTALLVAVRLASLMLRAWRLNRLIARTEPASVEIRKVVAEQARGLGVASPTVRAGRTAPDALLAGLARPVLVLPQALAEAPTTPAARAVITHELAHLKRGDHRAVWIEEAVVALLAVNPVLPLIRARRAAAREEACDALALTGAEPAARRAYAQSLIEALRARTERTTLPALTFTGTPRSRAMRRLKSILTPPTASGRLTRLTAVAGGLGLIAAAGVASMAVAGQREPVSGVQETAADEDGRVINASASDLRLFCASPDGSSDRNWCDVHLWSAALDESRRPAPAFCAPGQDDAGLRLIGRHGRDQVLVGADAAGSAEDGARRALAAAFPCQGEGRRPAATEVAAAQAELAPRWSAQHAARMAAESAARAAGFRALTPDALKTQCAAGGTTEAGCDGVIFGMVIGENLKPAASRAFCAPDDSNQATQIAATVKTAVRRTSAQGAESGRDFLRRVVVEAYPCDNARPRPAVIAAQGVRTDQVVAWVPVNVEGPAASLADGEYLHVALIDADGRRRAETVAAVAGGGPVHGVRYALTRAEFPTLGQGNRVYQLVGEVRADGVIRRTAEPVTVRLAPGSQHTVRNMSSTLTFRN